MGIIEHINALEPQFAEMTDEELRAKTTEFKEILAKRKTSDDFITDRKLEKEALDAQAKNEIAVDLLIPFSGNYVFLDTGLEDLVNFVRRFWRDMERFNPYGGLLSGKLRMGFIVREDGLMDGFQRMLDSIFPDYAYENYMRWFKFGRLPGGDINVAVVDGKVIPVWVVADYDFDAMTMGFKCYMIKEEDE